jgi:Flp pilus assembly protein TadD
MSRLRFAAFLLTGVALAACSSSSDPTSMTLNARPGDAVSGDLDVQIRRAQLLRVQGNYTDATRALSQMMIAVPDDPRVVGEYGKLLAQKGQPQDAIAFLRRATELNATDWTLWSAMGVAYDQINDPNAARVAYDRALSLKPNDPTVLNNFAMSRVLANDLPQAARLINQAKLAGGSDPKIAKNAEMIAGLMPAQQSATPMTMPVAQAPQAAPVTAVTRSQAPVMSAPLANAQQPYVTLPAQPRPTAPQPVAREDMRQPTGAPRSLQPQASANAARPKMANVRMMEVPFDPLAGPVANRIKLKQPKTAVAKAERAKTAKAETKTAQAEVPAAVAVTPEKKVAKSDVAKVDVKAASSKPEAKPEPKPAAKPQKTQFADSKKDGGIPRLRMASDSSEP